MATISISGTNKLAERIVGEAEAEAQKIFADAEAQARAITAQSEKVASLRRAEFSARREVEKNSLIGGYKTRAALDGRKGVLAKKRAVIDRVFSDAYAALLALDERQRRQICEKLLFAETEGGETIVPAAKDRSVIESLLSTMPDKHLSLSKENAAFDGGFLMVAKGYEKDCSFVSLLNDLRGAEETNVAKLLFD